MNFTSFAFSKGYLYHDSIKNANIPSVIMMGHAGYTPQLIQFQAELMRFGYILDDRAMAAFCKADTKEQLSIIDNVIDYLSNAYGDGHFVSLFGNFPYKVLDMSVEEMFIYQIMHYLSHGEFAPKHDSTANAEELQVYRKECVKDTYKVISFANAETLCDLYKNVCNAQQSLTSFDKEAIEYAAKNYKSISNVLTAETVFGEEIPFKETLCIVATNCPDYKLKTVTDVLRTVAYMSGLDVALTALPTAKTYGWERFINSTSSYYKERLQGLRNEHNFRKFNRTERKEILSRLETVLKKVYNGRNVDNVLAEFKSHLGTWVRLGEILHPGEYSKQYPICFEVFTILRNTGRYIQTFNGKLECARKNDDFEEIISLLSSRPGEFARNIDWVLRKYPTRFMDTLKAFQDNAVSSMSTKLLYELIEHFNSRNAGLDRFVFIKGARSAYELDKLPVLNDTTVAFLMQILRNELTTRFNKKETLDGYTYYLDGRLANIAIPKNMRSMNIMPGQVARGSKIPIDTNTGIFRMYCRWFDEKGRYDLDLAVTMFDEDFKYRNSISWNTDYKLKNKDGQDMAAFSGDVRHRCSNCAEYIDVDVNGMKNAGVRYLVSTVCDFDGQGFDKKDAWGGIMERERIDRPGITTWAPDTVTAGFKLTSKCTNIVMSIIDLETMTMYLVDEDINGIPVANTKANVNRLGSVIKRYVTVNPYFNALSLIETNLQARNVSVSKVISDVSAFEDAKVKTEEKINQLTSRIDELKNSKDTTDSTVIKNIYDSELSKLNEELTDYTNRVFISYDDISKDYTKLFTWMF